MASFYKIDLIYERPIVFPKGNELEIKTVQLSYTNAEYYYNKICYEELRSNYTVFDDPIVEYINDYCVYSTGYRDSASLDRVLESLADD